VPLVTAALLLLGFAPAPFPRSNRPTDDARVLEGTWMRSDGSSRILIKRGQMIYHPGPGAFVYRLKLTPGKRPASYDLTGAAGGPTDGWAFLGIYRLEGATLTLCYNPAGKGRPTAFAGAGRGLTTEVYRRVRP
jgi:uncharacterized protein (TIGR03067 family)